MDDITNTLYVTHLEYGLIYISVQYVPEKSEPNFKHLYSKIGLGYANYYFSVRKCDVNTKPCENCKA